MQIYSDPERQNDKHALPNVEVFYIDETDAGAMSDGTGELFGAGYYYWYCFPGCMPDSQPIGPFATEAEAIDDVLAADNPRFDRNRFYAATEKE
jgi:hypothetical protein